MSDFVTIAQIGRPVGLDGWCRVFPQGKSLSALRLPAQVQVGIDAPNRVLTLKALRGPEGTLQARFDGFNDRDGVDTLKNLVLYIDRDQLPPTAEGEFYHFELEGMEAFTLVGEQPVGVVIGVHNYPSVDALEIRKPNGVVLEVPFNDAGVPRIDREARRVFLDASFLEEIL